MKKSLFLATLLVVALIGTSCSKGTKSTTPNENAAVEVDDSTNVETELAEEAEATIEVEDPADVDYDALMDMYVTAVKEGNEESIMAITENIAESTMEGWLTSKQIERWEHIDLECQ